MCCIKLSLRPSVVTSGRLIVCPHSYTHTHGQSLLALFLNGQPAGEENTHGNYCRMIVKTSLLLLLLLLFLLLVCVCVCESMLPREIVESQT